MKVIKNGNEYMACLNNNNCKNVIHNMDCGMNVIDAFKKEIKRAGHNPKVVNTIQSRNDKYYWIFTLLEYAYKKPQYIDLD